MYTRGVYAQIHTSMERRFVTTGKQPEVPVPVLALRVRLPVAVELFETKNFTCGDTYYTDG